MKAPDEKPPRLATRDANGALHIPSIFPGSAGELRVLPPVKATPDVFTFSIRPASGGPPRAIHVNRDVFRDAILEMIRMVKFK